MGENKTLLIISQINNSNESFQKYEIDDEVKTIYLNNLKTSITRKKQKETFFLELIFDKTHLITENERKKLVDRMNKLKRELTYALKINEEEQKKIKVKIINKEITETEKDTLFVLYTEETLIKDKLENISYEKIEVPETYDKIIIKEGESVIYDNMYISCPATKLNIESNIKSLTNKKLIVIIKENIFLKTFEEKDTVCIAIADCFSSRMNFYKGIITQIELLNKIHIRIPTFRDDYICGKHDILQENIADDIKLQKLYFQNNNHLLKINMKISSRFKGKKILYSGTIVDINDNGITIHYDDGDKSMVPSSYVYQHIDANKQYFDCVPICVL